MRLFGLRITIGDRGDWRSVCVWIVAGFDLARRVSALDIIADIKAAHRTSQKSATGHRSATTSPEVVMTADTLAVIWRAVAKAYPTNKRHGLPGCRHSRARPFFLSFDRAG
jgi:hypothetical protein